MGICGERNLTYTLDFSVAIVNISKLEKTNKSQSYSGAELP